MHASTAHTWHASPLISSCALHVSRRQWPLLRARAAEQATVLGSAAAGVGEWRGAKSRRLTVMLMPPQHQPVSSGSANAAHDLAIRMLLLRIVLAMPAPGWAYSITIEVY